MRRLQDCHHTARGEKNKILLYLKAMSGQDTFMFLLTFLTGIFLGAFIYVTSFKPTYAPDDIGSAESTAGDFSVIAKAYGGVHERGYISPSFRVLSEGSYMYIQGGVSDSALEPIEGKLPSSLLRQLKVVATEDTLVIYEEEVGKSNCRSFADGVDYEYRITLEEIEYSLDTCTSNVPYDSALAIALDDVWTFISGTGTYTGPQGGSLSDKATDFIRKNLSPYEE